ncbi:S-adenosyl-L-methionine dependent methyltransferase [Heliocybe sulcata]|uniref:S-adenosyl-L-methionine dependent methyltransferase n=1 Tax=Heliocybe sulcata TaxID=5364 RepID=A0A5C3MIS6_9AGAM|nr:S-adenosyl-L-methionine dependent methyltransferase [Heliocybe sulcata]
MHPRNPYHNPPDFNVLAEAYPPLKACLIRTHGGNATIDFKDEASQRRLTEALLKRDFDLIIDIPDDRLCPPVPNRLNYILWLQDVLGETGEEPRPDVRGMDIGTGASVIYPLLACRFDPRWHFVATEIDDRSYAHALRNITQNGLQDRIQLVRAPQDGSVLQLSLFPDFIFDFTMCNPPFYTSKAEVDASAEAKLYEPNAVCTGGDVEMITPGGDSAFVKRMVDESLEIRGRCRWYTSMLGKLSSVAEVIQYLRQHEIDNYGVTEFVQGHTRRWAVIWSFGYIHLPDPLGRIGNPTIQHLMPPRNILRQPFSTSDPSKLSTALQAAVENLDGVITMHRTAPQPAVPSAGECLTLTDTAVAATKNSWSRAARRKTKSTSSAMDVQDVGNVVMRCRLQIRRMGHDESGKEDRLLVDATWVEGRERALFESFVSHAMRKATSSLA